MNKKELRKAIIELPVDCSGLRPKIDQLTTLELIKLLDEPQKVAIPQFVADWIEEAKTIYSLSGGITFGGTELNKWLAIDDNQETFALAWILGYEVEEEPRYTVKIKTVLGQYLGRYYLNNEELTPQFIRTQVTGKEKLPTFTQKELEEADFGWVFDCEGIEVEEVEE